MRAVRVLKFHRSSFGFGFMIKDEGKPYNRSAEVIRVTQGSPADTAGLNVGDQISSINNVPVKHMTFLDVFNLLRNSSEQTIELSIECENSFEHSPRSLVSNSSTNDFNCFHSKQDQSYSAHSLDSQDSSPRRLLFISIDSSEGSVANSRSKNSPNSAGEIENELLSKSIHTSADLSLIESVPIPKPRRSIGLPSNSSGPVRSSFHDPSDNNTRSVVPLNSSYYFTQNHQSAPTSSISTDAYVINPQLRQPNMDHACSANETNFPFHDFPTDVKENKLSGNKLKMSNSFQASDFDLSRGNPVFDNTEYHKATNSCLNADLDKGQSVRFVRKRAYASARHIGRYDQTNLIDVALSTNSSEPHASSHVFRSGSTNSPCQLLRALSAKSPTHNVEPKVTHLPRRKSSSSQLNRPSITTKGPSDMVVQSPPFSNSNVIRDINLQQTHQNLPRSESDRHLITIVSTSTAKIDNTISLAGCDHPELEKSQPVQDRLRRPENQEQHLIDSSLTELFTRAGESYHHLEVERKRLLSKQKAAHLHVMNFPPITSNNALPLREPTKIVSGSDYSLRCSKHSDQDSTTNSVHRENEHVPPTCSSSNLQTNSFSNEFHSSSRWTNLCMGLRSHRSESPNISVDQNIVQGVPSTFLARQCFCKILAISCSDSRRSKTPDWNAYHIYIDSSELKFIMSSLSFSGDGQSATTANSSDYDLVLRTRPLISSPSCFALPTRGLIWRPELLPKGFLLFTAVGTELSISSNPTSPPKANHTPDWMDPRCSGLSQPSHDPSYLDTLIHPKTNLVRENDTKYQLMCYRFAHLTGCAELLVLFPDETTAANCLKLCHLSGGREISFTDESHNKLPSNPYDLVFLKRSNNTIILNPRIDVRWRSSETNLSPDDALCPLKDKRHRQHKNMFNVEKDNLLTDFNHFSLSKNSNKFTKTDSESKKLLFRGRPKVDLGSFDSSDLNTVDSSYLNNQSDIDISTGVGQTTELDKSHPTLQNRPNKLLRGIKQLLNRPSVGGSSSPANFNEARENNHSSLTLEDKLAAVLGDPPDLSEFETPGPVFGAPLEMELESPDYPYVPVMLQMLTVALEIHGLNLPGLYRKPGRHRTIAQFVCVSNLAPDNLELFLTLEAWHEPNVLCGLVKLFLRRLQTGLFNLTNWEPLISIVPNSSTNDSSQLAYLLLSIRVQLKKMALEAFGIENVNTIQVGPSGFDESLNKQQLFSQTSTAKSTLPMWRWATLCYLVRHVIRVVAHEKQNAVNFQCIAICFGPVFFADSAQIPRFNGVLEYMFRHWHWLTRGLPLITKSLTEAEKAQKASMLVHEPTMLDALCYLNNCKKSQELVNETASNGGARPHSAEEVRSTSDTSLSSNRNCEITLSDPGLDMSTPNSSTDNYKQCPSDSIETSFNGSTHVEAVLHKVKDILSRAILAASCVENPNKQYTSHTKNYVKLYSSLHRTTSVAPLPKTEFNCHRRLTVISSNFTNNEAPHSNFCPRNENGRELKITGLQQKMFSMTNQTPRSTHSQNSSNVGYGAVVRRPVVPPTSTSTMFN